MARLQILQLPEGAGDDRPPYLLVIDEYQPRRYIQGAGQDEQPVNEFDGIAEGIGARAILTFVETVDIPANDVPPLPLLSVQGDSQTAELIHAHEQTRLALCDAFLLSLDATWAQIVETAMQRQREVAGLRRQLDGVPKAGQDQRRAALTDALGMDPLRDWDDIYNAAAGLRKERDAQKAALERVRRLPKQPEIMDSQHPDPSGYLHGYSVAISAARGASWNAPRPPWKQAPTEDDGEKASTP